MKLFLAAAGCAAALAGAGAWASPAATAPGTGTAGKSGPATAAAAEAPGLMGAPAHPLQAPRPKAPVPQGPKVDINNATVAQLKTLPHVGDAEAQRIVAHRPYRSRVELVSKAGLPEGVYQVARDRIVINEPRKAAAQPRTAASKP